MTRGARRLRPGLRWALKRSFIGYVSGLPGSSITVGNGAGLTKTGEFFFPYDEDTSSSNAQVAAIAFRGTLAMTAHLGILHVEFANPRIHVEQGRTHLSVEFASASGDRTRLMELEQEKLAATAVGDERLWAFEACLSASATGTFGGVYAPGELFDQVRVLLPDTVKIQPV